MKVVEGLRYTKNHEWLMVEDQVATIGITDYAQSKLGQIVFVELPEEEDAIDQEDVLSTIESVKAASDIFMPIGGTVVEVNEALEDEPELVNEDPYKNYICKVAMEDESQLDELMDADAYYEYITSL